MPEPAEHRSDRRRIAVAVASGIAAVAVVALLLVGLMNQERSTVIVDALEANERPPAPAMELPVLIEGGGLEEGQMVSLEGLRGRPVLLNFWASWCTSCDDEAPVLEQIWQTYRDRGLLVLGVDVRDLSADARAFDDDYGLTYPSVRDGDASTERDFETVGVPESFLIDRQGRIVAKLTGPILSPDQITAAIEGVL